MLKSLMIMLSLCAACIQAQADEASNCAAAAGTYRTGVVVRAPKFAHGQYRKGIELSHTHVMLKADQDGATYDVAIDNVFASGYDRNTARVPAPLNDIRVNDRLSLCGELYTRGIGIHWVHTSCGRRANARHPNGWLKRIAADGSAGENFEGSTEYCSIF